MKTIRYPILAAGILAIMNLGVAGVAMADPVAAHSENLSTAVGDTAITGKVKAKFISDDQLKGSDISVTTTNGVVTLTGTASNADASSRAKALANAVDGVKSVDNEIQAPSMVDRLATKTDKTVDKTEDKVSDGWITTKVKTQLLADSEIKGKDIHVKTRGGVVALSGKVQSSAQRDRTVELTKQIKGVKDVNTAALKVAGG